MTWKTGAVLVSAMLLLLSQAASWAACTTAQLTTELQTDPKQLGYAPLIAAGKDQAVLETINLPRVGADFQVNRGVVQTHLLLEEMVVADLVNLLSGTPAKMPLLQLYLSVLELDTSNANVQGSFLNLFPAGTPSRTNLMAFFKKEGSRADVLCGGPVTLSEVSAALMPLRP